MTLTITHLYRHPIKGLTPEPLTHTTLAVGEGIAQDRRFAIAHGTTVFDEAMPGWIPKSNFLMLMANARLAALKSTFDETSGVLTIDCGDGQRITADIRTAEGRAHIDDYLADFLGDEARGRPRLVEAPGHMFSDHRNKVLSLINLASLRELERALGRPIDKRRFRGNLYFDGAEPWQEFKWLGHEIAVGSARLQITERIDRCPATNVDPQTGVRDMKIPKALREHFGHIYMGVYGRVSVAGPLAIGDPITPPT